VNLKSDFWGAVIGSVIVVGIPALVWGGSVTARVESLAKNHDELRKEIREDLRDINRKLDSLVRTDTLMRTEMQEKPPKQDK
jgi:hypothetical protein